MQENAGLQQEVLKQRNLVAAATEQLGLPSSVLLDELFDLRAQVLCVCVLPTVLLTIHFHLILQRP